YLIIMSNLFLNIFLLLFILNFSVSLQDTSEVFTEAENNSADICHAYHTLINHGVNPENIITMMYDDIANNTENPHKGKIFNDPHGEDVYAGVRIDYKNKDVTPENFAAVLLGDSQITGGKRVLESTKDDKVFIYFTDHGATGLIGFPSDIMTVKNFSDTLIGMHKRRKYKELTFYLEACESGSMFDAHMPENLKIYAMTAANGHESSWGCYCETEILPGNCLGDLFSVNWMDDSDKENLLQETLARQFRIVRRKTDKSHVQSFGSINIKHEHVAEFMGSKEPNKSRKNQFQYKPRDFPMYPSRDIPLFLLAKKLQNNENDLKTINALQMLQKKRRYMEKQITQIVEKLISDPVEQLKIITIYPTKITNLECHNDVMHTFNKNCFNFSENSYAMKYAFVLTNLCGGIEANKIVSVMKQHCTQTGVKSYFLAFLIERVCYASTHVKKDYLLNSIYNLLFLLFQIVIVKLFNNMASYGREDIEEILAEIDGSLIEEYEKFFDRFDKHNHGYIMATQIGQIMKAMEQEFDERTLRRLIRKFDADGSGKIEFDEFCALVYTVANSIDKETLRRELREAFRLFDKEGNGYISTITLKELLKEIAPDLSEKELESAVDDIDQNGSGKIEFEEFWELMAGEEE
ncbi:Legumain, partial [Meloidogyne graminicola]